MGQAAERLANDLIFPLHRAPKLTVLHVLLEAAAQAPLLDAAARGERVKEQLLDAVVHRPARGWPEFPGAGRGCAPLARSPSRPVARRGAPAPRLNRGTGERRPRWAGGRSYRRGNRG